MISRIQNFNIKNTPSFGKFSQEIATAIKEQITQSKTVGIFAHAHIDHDGLNSTLLAGNLVRKLGGDAQIYGINEQELQELTLGHRKLNALHNPQSPDLLMIVDCNGTDRISKKLLPLIQQIPRKIIIDHHRHTPYTIDSNFAHINPLKRSCCGIFLDLFQSLGFPIDRKNARRMAIGTISDYKKTGLVELKNSQLIQTEALKNEDPAVEATLKSLQEKLSEKDWAEICIKLDVISNLNAKEKTFRKNLFEKIQTSPNGKLAFAIVSPDDRMWKALGFKTERMAEILRDFRKKLTNGIEDCSELVPKQQKKLEKVEEAAVFYPTKNGEYRFSLTSKNKRALDMLDFARKVFQGRTQQTLIGDGHSKRVGGRILNCDKTVISNLIESFKEATEIVN